MMNNGPAQAAADFDDDLLEAAVEEFTERLRAGESPTVAEYAARHPQLATMFNELLPTIAAVERAKSGPRGLPEPARPGLKMPERVGDFRIVREIGYGGMGIVYEAVQESLDRRVALKVLPAQMLLDPQRVARFEQEARLAAQLHHPNIVPVFGVGHAEGLHYYVMQLIDGEGLDRRLARGAEDGKSTVEHWPTARQAAAVGRDVARALQLAHEQGTLHRDVKPANILIDARDHVWLTDFGLARVHESEATATAHLGGTLRYMPPERFQGVSDARGDLYSLGVTLFELLARRSPFDAETNVELMRQITQTELPRLRSIDPRVPRDLETIVAKATAREPRSRYASAAELADDLQRFLDGVPIRARRTSGLDRAWRWCRRNRLSATALAAAATAVVTLGIVSTVGYWRTAKLNTDLTRSLDNERLSRESAQATSGIALEALDKVFVRFTPSGSFADRWGGLAPRELSLPVQPVSPQIAAALEDLLPYYSRLAEQRASDPRVRREAAAALQRIGLIHARLGRFDEAQRAWNDAAGLLSDSADDDEAARHAAQATQLAALRCDQGDVERHDGRFNEARAAYEQARAALAAIAENDRTFDARRELARAELALSYRDGLIPNRRQGGGPGFDDGPPGANRPPHPRGPGFGPPGAPPGERPHPDDPFGALFDGPPDGPPGSRRPGEGLPDGGPPEDVLGLRPHLDAAFALLSQLLAERPHDPPTRLLMARCRVELAKHGPGARVDLDSSDLAEAVRLLNGLRDDFPAEPEYAYALGVTLADFEPRDVPMENLAKAESQLREALTISKGLSGDPAHGSAFALDRIQIEHRLAQTLDLLDRREEAESGYRRTLEAQEQLLAQLPAGAARALWQARVEFDLAKLLARDGRPNEARPLLESAATAVENYARLAEATPEIRDFVGELHHRLGELRRAP